MTRALALRDDQVQLHVKVAAHWRNVSMRLGHSPIERANFRRWMRVHARAAAKRMTALQAGTAIMGEDTGSFQRRVLSRVRTNRSFYQPAGRGAW